METSLDMRRNYARERSELHRKVRPLGDFIARAARAKAAKLPIPPVPTVRPAGGVAAERVQPRLPAKGEREAPVLKACLRWLHEHRVFAWRNNTGTLWSDGQPVTFGFPGSADITGILPDGRRLEIECKSPTGKQSEKQKTFQAKIEQNKGVYLLVHSLEELIEQWAGLSKATVSK